MTTKIKPALSATDGAPICHHECPRWGHCSDQHTLNLCRPAVLALLAEVDAERAHTLFDEGHDITKSRVAVDAWRKPK